MFFLLFFSSKWNGLTVADLVFPWFMWIMGVSLAISIQSQLRNSRSRSELVMNILRRSAILFFLGLIINSLGGHNDLRLMRIPGVLQRFAVAYLVVGLMQTLLASRELSSLGILGEDNAVPWWWVVRDIKACLVQWFVMISMVIVHTCLTFLLPVPGCPTGYLGPGGLHDGGKFQNCTGGSARYFFFLLKLQK
jgi:heparan-alpha-glucosaminide N-acetyltransferase